MIPYDALYNALIIENFTYKECADLFNCCVGTIQYYMDKFQIKPNRTKKPRNTGYIHISYNDLYDAYINQKMTTYDCGRKFNCTNVTISNKLREYKIPVRKHSVRIHTEKSRKFHIDKSLLLDLYVNQRKSSNTIGKMLGYSNVIILNRMKEYGIPVRENAGWANRTYSKISLDKDLLKELYINQKKSVDYCRTVFDCSPYVIKRNLEEIGISPRGLSESHIGYKMPQERIEYYRIRFLGSGNPSWNGGVSKIPYPENWHIGLKRKIRNRDGNICQICMKTDSSGHKLCVHHIDMDKNNCDEINLISLCKKCHAKTHNNSSIAQEFLSKIAKCNSGIKI